MRPNQECACTIHGRVAAAGAGEGVRRTRRRKCSSHLELLYRDQVQHGQVHVETVEDRTFAEVKARPDEKRPPIQRFEEAGR